MAKIHSQFLVTAKEKHRRMKELYGWLRPQLDAPQTRETRALEEEIDGLLADVGHTIQQADTSTVDMWPQFKHDIQLKLALLENRIGCARHVLNKPAACC